MIPVPRKLRRHQVTVPAAGEWIDWILYDTQVYVDNSTTRLDFFTTMPTNIVDSNMETPGQMPGQKMLLLRALGVVIGPALNTTAGSAAIADVQAIINQGALRLEIGSKSYSEWPLARLNAGGGVHGHSYTAGSSSAFATNGAADPRATYVLARPLLLTSSLNFKVRCEWASAINTAANCRVRVMLKGELGRPVQ